MYILQRRQNDEKLWVLLRTFCTRLQPLRSGPAVTALAQCVASAWRIPGERLGETKHTKLDCDRLPGFVLYVQLLTGLLLRPPTQGATVNRPVSCATRRLHVYFCAHCSGASQNAAYLLCSPCRRAPAERFLLRRKLREPVHKRALLGWPPPPFPRWSVDLQWFPGICGFLSVRAAEWPLLSFPSPLRANGKKRSAWALFKRSALLILLWSISAWVFDKNYSVCKTMCIVFVWLFYQRDRYVVTQQIFCSEARPGEFQ